MRSSSFPRPTAGFGFAGNENCRESSAVLAPKKEGPPLGMGAPEGAFQLLASFSHQRVGSSITCFPLRGRWERSAKSDKQAPSPSLVTFCRSRSEEHTSELQSHHDLVCRLLLEKKKNRRTQSSL